jgi:ABC-type multidrug transport system fused ATPase/permease subunit
LIHVIQDGVVCEQGSHTQLLRRDGLYADMWNRQLREEQVQPEHEAEPAQ